jgi:hypothetical protein
MEINQLNKKSYDLTSSEANDISALMLGHDLEDIPFESFSGSHALRKARSRL